MDQDFQWGSPYLDPQALNAREGSVSYFDFKWWDGNNPPGPVGNESVDETIPEKPVDPVSPEDVSDNPDDAGYDIIQA